MSGDRISLHGIRAFGRHGARVGERDTPQPLDVDVEIELDLARARASDALSDTLDYSTVHAKIVEVVRERSYTLLERLAEEIASAIIADPLVRAVAVTISKPEILDGATPSVSVRAERG